MYYFKVEYNEDLSVEYNLPEDSLESAFITKSLLSKAKQMLSLGIEEIWESPRESVEIEFDNPFTERSGPISIDVYLENYTKQQLATLYIALVEILGGE